MIAFSNPAIDGLYVVAAVLITYVSVFHLLLWSQSRQVLNTKTATRQTPLVSVIVPAYNERRVIKKTIRNLLALDYPKRKLKIIVVDDGSTDDTFRRAKEIRNGRVKVFRKANGGKASALNFGIARSKNEFVAVVDADSTLEKSALLKAVQYFVRPEIAAVTTHILVKRKKAIFEKWQNLEFMIVSLARKIRESLNLIDATPGPMSVYRRKALLKVGKFDEKNVLEDVEIAWRLLRHGYKIKMAYDAIVHTNYPDKFKDWVKQRTRWGVGGLQTLVKHSDCLGHAHPVGTFILPLSLIGYVLQVAGVFLFAYLAVSWLASYGSYIWGSLLIGSGIRLDLYYLPNVMSFYGSAMILLGLLFVAIVSKSYRVRPRPLVLLTFVSFYIFLFPLIGVYSLYKYLRKDVRWLTK